MPNQFVTLGRKSNQARGIAQYAVDFCRGDLGQPADCVLRRTELFHVDSVGCAIAALACGTNAPLVLRAEALEYPFPAGASCFGSPARVQPEKAVLANCAAVRELDSNGTNFGFNLRTGNMRGEFGHNDFYPVVMAGCQQAGWNGAQALRAMVCLDEIRGRLAEVFALKDHAIDHVLHGAIASAAVYGAILGGTVDRIESAIGLTVAHYVPFRAIRAGHQLTDSKGASAAISAEVAVVSARRALRGFVGPEDVFRNPQAVFCLFEQPGERESSPFDLELATQGDDFAVMGMHFKLGLYEHQSAGAIQGLLDLLQAHPELLEAEDRLQKVRISIYQPAFGIIGDPAKRDPRTRQSADHSMVYIIATLLRKAFESGGRNWEQLMLLPSDYSAEALFHPFTRRLMERIEFVHGGPDFDRKYPDGIPTSVELVHMDLGHVSSGLVMYPEGHARNPGARLPELLAHKFRQLASLGVVDADRLRETLLDLQLKSPEEIQALYEFPICMP